MAMEAYVTLSEAADLEGVMYKTFRQRTLRNPEAFHAKKVDRCDQHGKPLTLVAVNTLSQQAQKAYAARQRVAELADAPVNQEEEESQKPQTGRPWYVDIDIDWYMRQYKKQYYRAAETGNVIREFLAYNEKNRTAHAREFARERLGKDARTLYRYVRDYLDACAWAGRLGEQDECSYDYFKILCFCRKPKAAGQFPSFTPEVKQAVKNIWFNEGFARNRGTREMLYEKLGEVAAAKGWEKIPSYASVARYINHLMADEGMKNAHYLAANGVREYKNRVMAKRRRDTTSLRVMEVLQGDEHTFDCWVAYTCPNGKVIPIRPKLVCWIDTRSRMILGDIICREANSQVLKQSLLKLIYHDTGGLVPRYLWIDNGKDYTGKEMNGVDRKDRHSKEAKEQYFSLEFDDAARGFYRGIGVEDVHIAMPYEPWNKGQIERFFGGVCSRFTKWLTSYTGTLTGSRTDAKVNKDIKRMAEKGQLLTMAEFYAQWTKWKEEKYAARPHSELKRVGEAYQTPGGLFANGERYIKAAPPKSQAAALMQKIQKAKVYNTGIHRFGKYYNSEELMAHIGETVEVRYDPDDVSTIYIYRDNRRLCEAVCQELLPFGRVSDGVLKEHRRIQNAQLKRDRRLLEEANRPFEELAGEAAAGGNMVGGIELMTGKEPVKAKVVSMPQSETYRRNIKKLKKEAKPSAYMAGQARKALEKLEAMEGL